MAVKVFYSEQFKKPHEIKQFEELYGVISSKYDESDEIIYILFNFFASEKQIDVLLLTEKGIAIVELKAYRGEIKGSKNGDWSVIGGNKKAKKFDNLFLQLKDQKFDLLKCLNEIREEKFKRIDKKDLGKIQCWGYFEKRSSYDVEEQLGRDVKLWFNIITADNLIDRIKFIKAGYTLKHEDMDAIVKELGLKEYSVEIPEETKRPKKDDTKFKIENMEKILLIFGYSGELSEEIKDGYFLLPTSVENILSNVARLNGHLKFIALSDKQQLRKFLDKHEDDIERQQHDFKYSTSYNTYSHNNRDSCQKANKIESVMAEESIHLKGSLIQKAKEAYDSYSPNVEQIYQDLVYRIKTIEDLLFLLLLNDIAEKNIESAPARIAIVQNDSDSTGFNLPKLLDGLGVDEDAINELLRWDSKFAKFTIDKIMQHFEKFLPSDPYSFLLLTAHSFNSTGCYLQKNLFLLPDLARFIRDNLSQLEIEEVIAKTYKERTLEESLEQWLERKFRIEGNKIFFKKKGSIEVPIENPPKSPDIVVPGPNTKKEILVGTKEKHGQEGILGRIGNADVLLDFYEPHAITILGVQGSGKSYATGAIIEMALREIAGISKIKQPLISIIFHFSKEEKRRPEWIGLVEANDDPVQIEMLKQYGAMPSSIPSNNINIFVPPAVFDKRKEEYNNLKVRKLSFSPSKLKAEDWQRLLTFGMGNDSLYLEIIKELMIDLRDENPSFGAEDLKGIIERSKDLNSNQKKFANIRIKAIGRWLDDKAAPLDEYLKPGIVNIVDFRDPLSVDEKKAAVLLQTLFSLIKDRSSDEICLVCIDEAHLFLRNEALTEDIVEFVKLLRKDYKVFLLLISQHPKDFHPDILGLSDVILCHKLNDEEELNFLKKRQPKFASILESINELNTKEGEAYILARVSTNSVLADPKLIKIRPKVTKDKGKTATAF